MFISYQIISDIENKKEREVNRLKAELKEKLKLCKTEEEKQQVKTLLICFCSNRICISYNYGDAKRAEMLLQFRCRNFY